MSESQLDILSIDSKIRNAFAEERSKLPRLHERISELKLTEKNNNLSHQTRVELRKNISELTQQITELEANSKENFYLIETTEYIQKYREMLKTPIKVSFVGVTTVNNKEKHELIANYLEMAQKYYPLKVELPVKKLKIKCDSCANKGDFIYEENLMICPDCGSQQELIQHTSSYKDIDRVNVSSTYTYDRRVHFRDCINQYQGKQNCTIDQKVYDDLENVLGRHLMLGKKTERKEVRFKKITRTHVLMFLKELGYSKHYENVILIHYNLTGKKPDDISYLEDKLLADFDLLIETYDKHFKHKVDRVNFISTPYVLYQLLRRHRHPCKHDDFGLLKAVERRKFHDEVCRELFSILGWSFTPLY